jgi:hypothetical protein
MSSDSLSEHETTCSSRKRMECAPDFQTAIQAAVRFHVTITRQANRRAHRFLFLTIDDAFRDFQRPEDAGNVIRCRAGSAGFPSVERFLS